MNWKFARRIDTNHQNEHFKTFFQKIRIQNFKNTLFKWYNIDMHEGSSVIKYIKQFNGIHDESLYQQIRNFFDPEDIDLVNKVFSLKVKHTNWNEAFHHYRLYSCTELIAHKTSFKIRNSLAAAFCNLGPDAYVNILQNLNINISQNLKQIIIKTIVL